MNHVLKAKEVQIRKQHRCFGCRTMYSKGSLMVKVVGIWEGDFNSDYWCKCCNDFWNTLDHESREDGIYPGDIWNFDAYEKFRSEHPNILNR